MLAKLCRRKNGISLLIPTQNSEQTILFCVESFLNFADEIIIVDNGSTDSTLDLLSEIEKTFQKVRVFNRPELPDLFHNRQFALKQSKYSWIVRIDSDYVAYTSGERDILKLRKRLLEQPTSFFPKVFSTKMINVAGSFCRTYLRDRQNGEVERDRVVETLPARIIRWYPFIKFMRLGRWEGIRFQRYLKKENLEIPYWMHLHKFQSKMTLLFRSERTNWRELGNYKKFPTLKSYIESVVLEKYGVSDFSEAANLHYEKFVEPKFSPYDPDTYYPYPDRILYEMEKTEKRKI